MAELSVQRPGLTGLQPAYSAVAASGGDTFSNDGRVLIHIKNGSGSTRTVTVTSNNCNFGSQHNLSITIPAVEDKLIGPLPTDRFGRTAKFEVDSNTSVTAAVVGL